MSYSEVTVMAILGQDARQISQSFRTYQSKRVAKAKNESSYEDWPKRSRNGMNRTIAGILGGWKSSPLVYAAKFLDNNSVAASQLHILHRLLFETCGLGAEILVTDKYDVLYGNGDADFRRALKVCSRKACILKQPAERQLCFLLSEACDVNVRSDQSSIILAVNEILEPTRYHGSD